VRRLEPRTFRLILIATIAISCATAPSEHGGPSITGVVPAEGPAGAETDITISGRDLEPAMFTNASCGGGALDMDTGFDAVLSSDGPYEFALFRIEWISSTEITAVVPSDLAADTYDLTLTDPRGRVVVLESAFRITEVTGSDSDADTDVDGDSDSDTDYDFTCFEPDECVETCGTPCSMLCDTTEFCKLNCNGGGCDFVCDGSGDCDLDCHQEGGCTATHTGTGLLDVKCAAGDCQISCPGTGGCYVDCDAMTCEITDCPQPVETCGDGLACNTPCP
jgi:hypothetical protein